MRFFDRFDNFVGLIQSEATFILFSMFFLISRKIYPMIYQFYHFAVHSSSFRNSKFAPPFLCIPEVLAVAAVTLRVLYSLMLFTSTLFLPSSILYFRFYHRIASYISTEPNVESERIVISPCTYEIHVSMRCYARETTDSANERFVVV